MPLEDVAGPYSRHIPALDGLRGLAVLGVMGFHLFPGRFPGRVLGTLGMVRVLGVSGVDLFFVLSGFLITGILYDSTWDLGYFRKFYARRALRIFPLYYGVLGVLFLITPWAGIHWHGMGWLLLGYLQNTDIKGPFYDLSMGSGVSLDHFWSLAVEEQFYLVWPLLVLLVPGRRRLMGICVGMMVFSPLLRFGLAMHGTDPNYINRSTPCRMDTLAAGALLALLLRGREQGGVLRAAKGVFWGVVATWCVLGVLGMAFAGRVGSRAAWVSISLASRYSLLALASTALVAWSLRPAGRLKAFCEGRVMRFFGRYSYGLYVLHFVALGFLLRTFKGWIAMVTPNKGVGVAGAGVLSFGIAVGAAYLSYNVYERHFLRLKRRFRYDRESARVVSG